MSEYMRPVQHRDVIRSVRDRFAEQYSHWESTRTFAGQGGPIGPIRAKLAGLDLETCAESDVDAAIGVSGWAANECDNCQKSVPVMLRIGDEPDYEARWVDLCAECLNAAVALLAATPVVP